MTDFDKYGTNLDKMAEREEIERPRRSSRTPTRWLTLEPDREYDLRILPGDPEAEGEWRNMPYMRIWQHWNVGPSENERTLCPRKMSEETGQQERCYVCEHIEGLRNTGDKFDEQKASKMRPSQSFIYQVIDREDPIWQDGDEGIEETPEMVGRPKIKFLRLPWSAHSNLLDFYADAEYGDLSHPTKGLDIKVSRTGSGLDTRYGIKTKRNNSPMFETEAGVRDDERIKDTLDLMSSLSKHPFFRMPTYDETVAAQLGTEPATSPQAVQAPRSRPSLPPARKAPSIQDWKTAVTTEAEGKFPPKAVSVAEIATWGGWTVKEVEESVPCYGKDPDHTEQGCWDCPIKAPCANVFHASSGRYSINEPAAPSAPPALPKLEPKGAAKEGNGSSVASMKNFLKNAGAK